MDAIISHGCFLQECSVEHTIVGVRSRLDFGVELKVHYNFFNWKISLIHFNTLLIPSFNVQIGSQMCCIQVHKLMLSFWSKHVYILCLLQDTMMMGADYYQTEAEIASLLAEGKVPIGVGQNTKIR